jgi:hypothetical protein
MVRSNYYYATKTTINGQMVDLEDIFDYLDKEVQDPDKTFEKMIKLFKDTDENIIDKLESLKFKLAQERPDEFVYVPDDDYGPSKVKKKPKPPPNRIEKDMSPEFIKMLIIIIATMFILIGIIITVVSYTSSDKKDDPTKPSIHIEKLEPL